MAVAAIAVAVGTGNATDLSTDGPVRVGGTTATAAYPYAGAMVREVRYVDTGRLSYVFTLANDGAVPVTVTGLARQPGWQSALLRPEDIRGAGSPGNGDGEFTVWPGEGDRVQLEVLMLGCEQVSSRAGSMLERIGLHVRVAGTVSHRLQLTLPERVHTGSPRDATCPNSSSATRSPG